MLLTYAAAHDLSRKDKEKNTVKGLLVYTTLTKAVRWVLSL